MQTFINSIHKALENENWHVALFTTLTFPDICTALEHGKTTGPRCSDWVEKNLPKYKGYLPGKDCWALRCALLHEGKDDISNQDKQEVLEHYVFLTKGAHCNLYKDCVFNGEKKSFLQLNVDTFCKDMCKAVEVWLDSVLTDPKIQSRLNKTIKIREPGYTYKGIVRFG